MLSSIEAERARHQWTKEELASKLGVSKRTLYNWVNERTDIPSSALIELSKLFGKSAGYLLQGSDKYKEEQEQQQ